MFPKQPQLEGSVVSRVSQPQLPDFAQIDHTDKAADFITGFEKFTQEIQNFIESKDEQMLNLMHERKNHKAALHYLDENSRFNAKQSGRVHRPIRHKLLHSGVFALETCSVVSQSLTLAPEMMAL